MSGQRAIITSRANPLLKQLRRAASRNSTAPGGFALAESPHLLDEALQSGVEIERVFASERAAESTAARIPPHRNIPLHVVAEKLFAEASTTARNQGVLSLVKLPRADPETVLSGLALALNGVQDPGNAGTLVRSAEAFGASGAVFLKGSCSPSNPKALRAAAGSLFRLPVLQGVDAAAFPELARRHGKKLLAAEARDGVPLPEADLSDRTVVVVGSETHGIAPALLEAATPVAIPTRSVESLNAAMAGTVILYEAWRRGPGR